MSDKSFVHLHSHGPGSALDGLTKVKEMIEVAKELSQPGIALTDHGNLSGAYDLYKAGKDSGVKPIFGIEAYLAPQVSRLHKEPVRWNPGGDDDVSGNGSYTHMTLLAKTDEGLHNLMKMSSEAFLSGYYYKPRMDDELLSQYGKGIIATSGCVSGEIQTLIRIGRYEDAKASAMKFQDIFGKGNFFIELMDHGLDIERRGLPDLIKLAKELKIPMVATNDLHYARKTDAGTHDALLAIGTGSTLDDPTRFKFDSQEFYIKTAQEMRAIWDSQVPEACDNTLLICEAVETTFHEGKDLMPKFDVPEGETEDSWLRKEVYSGLNKKFPEGLSQEYKDRVEHELGVVNQLGFASYFLVTADFIAWARENGIRVGPGRGSSAGSIIAYALAIVQVDPIRFGLIFERFLNLARASEGSPPDIDIDFQPEGRERVIEYITQKYGPEKVAAISTSMQMKGKSSLRDSARVLGATYGLADKLNKVYPKPIIGRDLSLKDLYDPENERYDEGMEFRNIVASDSEALKVVELAKALEGTKRGFGMHAAGIILSREPIVNTVPLMKRDSTSAVMTQFEYPVAESLGLIKFDFLGLSNLSTISECLRLIKKNKGIEVDLDRIGELINDTKTFRLLARGDTLGVFQLDSGPMRSLLRLMAVDSFDDISAVLALYRPGPMSQGSDILFADRKNGRKKIIPIHPELKESLNEVLGKTYGLCVTGDTLIWDAKSGSRVRIDSLEERIISGRFKTFGVNKEGKVEAFKVINWFNTGKKKTLAVKTRSGGEIKLSKDHQVLTPRGWIKAGELEPGVDRMAIPRSIFDKSSTKDGMSKEKARFLGYMLGDGYINLYQNTFINSNIAFLEEVARLSESIFPDVYPVLSDRRKEVRTLVGKNGQVTHPLMASSICFMATPRGFGKGKRIGNVHGGRYDRLSLNVWLKELGYDLNTRSNTKFVPEQIFASSNEVISEFIAGLWDTDGHVNNRFATLKTISKRLAYDTQALLQRLGIFSTIYETETYKSLKGDRIAYQVTIGEPVFWDIIVSRLFLSEKRVEHRGALQASYTQGLNGKLMLEKMFPLISEDEELPHWVRKRMKSRGSVAIHAVRNYLARKYEATLSTTLPPLSKDLHYMPAGELGQLYLEKLGDTEDLFYANQHWTLIDEVVESGLENMYDITVDEVHNFIANGFVVHNCIYQEQVMQIAQKVAGYSLVQADLLRRAMGKKKKEILDKEFEGFKKGMIDNGYSDDCVQTLWDVLLPFADYAFNLSHSVAYAMIAYWTAYLKSNFPVEYMAALLSTNADDKDKSAIYLAECRRMGIRVLNPDVNLSESLYSAVGEDIRVGLSAIKGVGEKSVEAWIVSRDERGFAKSFSDFLENGDSAICKKNVVAALIKSGAFDSFGKTRASLDAVHVEAVERAAAMKKSKGKMKKGQEQDSLFGPDDSAMFSVMIPEIAEWDQQLLLSYEKDMLGLYVSGHPLADLTDAILNWQEVSIADLKEGARSGSTVKIAGLVTSFERKVTKKGDAWALITLEDLDANIVVYCFPRTYNAAADILKSDAIVIISGKSEPRDDGSVAFMASSITAPNLSKVARSDPQLWMDRQVIVQDELSDGTPVVKPKGDPEDNRQINIKVLESDLTPENVERLKVALVDHPGYRPVTVLISDEDGNSLGTMELEYKVYGSADLGAKIRYLFGSSAV